MVAFGIKSDLLKLMAKFSGLRTLFPDQAQGGILGDRELDSVILGGDFEILELA